MIKLLVEKFEPRHNTKFFYWDSVSHFFCFVREDTLQFIVFRVRQLTCSFKGHSGLLTYPKIPISVRFINLLS